MNVQAKRKLTPHPAQAPPPAPILRPKERKPIGQILVESGLLSVENKLRTLEAQTRVNARFGDILLAHGLIDQTQLTQALATQYGSARADFDAIPPDLSLVNRFGLERCVERGILPWTKRDGVVLVAFAQPERFEAEKEALERLFGPVEMVVTNDVALHQAVINRHPKRLAARAETRVSPFESCRGWSGRRAAFGAGTLVIALLAATIFAPSTTFLALLWWTLATLVAQTALKLAAWITQVQSERRAPPPAPALPPSRLPTVSILVPLYKEREIASRLIERLRRIAYPRELLDICLVVESDDLVTAEALNRTRLPSFMRQIVVPAAPLKTKPRALNYALDFCRGEIVGVYDAEDAPAPDQIRRVAERFRTAPPEVVCLQGVLDYYNAQDNWMARCFTIEYATWFRLILPGLMRLGLVIPLGGTTLFFRRAVLEAIGGWDAHNVTEDADLGIRLARHGFRTELIDTVTEEEANCRVWPWVRQRSRWLKGYAVTWAVHNRNPARLWRELGAWRFFGVQLLLLGTLTQFAIAPLLWSFWFIALGLGHPVMDGFSSAVIWTIAAIFIASEAISIGTRLAAVRRTKHRRLLGWVPSLYFYFPLATLASYKALSELLTRPFYWDKTAHGQSGKTPSPSSQRQA